MPLIDIPIDILSIIFTHLPREDLTQAMLVCRVFRDIVEPLLYRSISLQSSSLSDGESVVHGVNHSTQLTGLLIILSAQPHLGRHVASLNIEVLMSSSDQSNLLGLLPHLQELSLSPPSTRLNITGHLLLKYVRLDFGDDVTEVGQQQLISRNFWTPALRTLQIEWMDLVRQEGCLFPVETYRTSPIFDLRLHVASFEDYSAEILSDILLSIKSLKRFTLDTEIDAVISHVINNWLSLDDILLALLPHADTLEYVSIAASDGSFLCRTLPSCSLMNFSSLKRLGMPESYLEYCRGSSAELVLPPAPEELQLQYQVCFNQGQEWRPHHENLNTLAGMKRTRLGALKLVVWWVQMSEAWYGSWKPRFTPQIEALVCKSREVGVLFYSVNEPYFKDTPFGSELSNPIIV